MNNNGYYYEPPFNPAPRQNAIQLKQKTQIRAWGNAFGMAIVLYYAVQYVLLFILLLSPVLKELYQNNVAVHYAFSIIISFLAITVPFVGAAVFVKKNAQASDEKQVEFLPNAKYRKSTIFWSVAVGSGLCMCCNMIASFWATILNFFGIESSSSSSLAPTTAFEAVLLFVAVAVIPAVCEEFAMRGAFMQTISKGGKVFAIFVSSIIFGFMHGNLTQVVFATLVGVVLAYITFKMDNILPAILIHFVNNAMSAISQIVSAFYGENASNTVYYFMFFVCVFLSAVGVIVLAKRVVTRREKEIPVLRAFMSLPSEMNLFKKLNIFFTSPFMVVGLILLFIHSISTINFG